ncbi:alpha/beta hydrolase [Giardia muris]|uniref:Alpha/beta hydrolase n=1 Tax=Giardia muris TaxID=5742 RepID=A0A4Z1T492_GIAMU|nr:alpha/beta hydrolase [Giardia muris]|eukprot:TNJ27867.1 alpha/beta hydrolase [Giardia muris]
MALARRCLMLHGYLSCADAFYARTGALRKALPGVDFIYAEAPLTLQMSERELIGVCSEHQSQYKVSVPLEALDSRYRPEGDVDPNKCRGWFLFEMGQETTSPRVCGSVACCDCLPRRFYGVDEARTFMLDLLQKHTPDFVLAFSQGATLLLYLLLDGYLVDFDLKVIVLVAPWIPHPCTQASSEVICTTSPKDPITRVLLEEKELRTSARVIMVYGEADSVISLEGLKSFRERHPGITYYTHSGGHMVPGSSDMRTLLRREFTQAGVT